MTLSSQKISKIKSFSFLEKEWITIFAFVDVLVPFYQATKMLSGTEYQTAAYGYIILKSLEQFLSSESSPEDLNETNYDTMKTDKYFEQVNLLNRFNSIHLDHM